VNFEQFIAYLPFAVGCGVAAVVFTVFVFRKRAPTRAPRIAIADPGPSSTPILDWMPPEDAFSDRRGSMRREGPPVKVVLSAASFRSKHDVGYVLDRSTGGLRIAMRLSMAPGSTMQVRAANAPDSVPWVTLIVRNCRNAGQHYELGCEFDKTPPWNVLLLFG
jgi:hypothetical protein